MTNDLETRQSARLWGRALFPGDEKKQENKLDRISGI